MPRSQTGRVAFIADMRGKIIASSAVDTVVPGQSISDARRARMFAEHAGVFDGLSERLMVMTAYGTPRGIPSWRVVVIEPIGNYRGAIRGPLLVLSVIALGSVLFAVTTAFLVTGWLVHPLRSLASATRASASGRDALPSVPPSPVEEFNTLRISVARADAVLRRRAAAERLALQEARTGHELLVSVVNGTADVIMVKDLEFRIVLANQAALALPAIARAEWRVLGRRMSEIVPAGDPLNAEALDREVIATGKSRSLRIQTMRNDGRPGMFLKTKTPWRNAAGVIAGVVTVLHDVTDHRAAEQRLASVQGELLRATRLSAMGAMASGLAHELNQPLAAATNFLNAASRLLSADGSGRRPTLELAALGA